MCWHHLLPAGAGGPACSATSADPVRPPCAENGIYFPVKSECESVSLRTRPELLEVPLWAVQPSTEPAARSDSVHTFPEGCENVSQSQSVCPEGARP